MHRALRVTLSATLLFAGVCPAAAQDAETEPAPLTPPTITRFVQADYPERAAAEGVESAVIVEIDISAEGEVESVRVLEGAQPEGYGFDEAALEAIAQFEFSPAMEGQTAVPVTLTYRYSFVLQDASPEPDPVPDPDTAVPAQDPEAAPARDPVANLQGTLLERGTRTPMAGVIVTVFQGETGFEAVSNAEGFFVFYDLPAGEWKVLVDPAEYYPVRTSESVADGQRTEVVYYVELGSYNPFDVLVEADRVKKEVTRRTISIREIERIPGNFGDPVKVVQNLPGVARTVFGDGRIIVRGSSPEDTRFYIQGIQVPLIYHFGGLRSVVPAGVLESIDFLPGNFPAAYGRSSAGVLDIKLKHLRPEAVHGYVDVNLFDSGVFLEAPVGDRAAVAVGARRSYVDTILEAAVPESAPINVIAAPRYYDFQTLVSYRPTDDHELQLFVFGSGDAVRLLFEDAAQANAQLRSGDISAETFFLRTMVQHDWIPSDSFKTNTIVGFGIDEVSFNVGEQFFLDLQLLLGQLREENTIKLTRDATLVVGADVLFGSASVDLLAPLPPKEGDPPGERDLDDTIRAMEQQWEVQAAVYTQLELTAIEDVLVVPGVRLERYTTSPAQWTYDPRLTVRWKVDEALSLKAGAGWFHQPPTPDELSKFFGNPKLHAEESIQYSVGGEYKPVPWITVDATVFYKDLFELVSRSNDVVERNGETVPEIYNNEGIGRVYGLELLLRHELTNNFFGWVTYTLSRAERLDSGESDYRPFQFDQTHILNVIASYRLPRNWEVGGRWRYVTGNPTTPVIGAVFNSDADAYQRVFGPFGSARLPAFHQLDLRVDKSWIYDTWILNLYMDIQNVYNRANTEAIRYNFNFTETQPQQGLPVFPALGIKATF